MRTGVVGKRLQHTDELRAITLRTAIQHPLQSSARPNERWLDVRPALPQIRYIAGSGATTTCAATSSRQQPLKVARTVHHSHQFHAVHDWSIDEDVVPHWKAPDPGAEFTTSFPDQWLRCQKSAWRRGDHSIIARRRIRCLQRDPPRSRADRLPPRGNGRSVPSAPARLVPAPRQLSATASFDLFKNFVGEFAPLTSIQLIDSLLHVCLQLLEPDRLLPFVILEQPQGRADHLAG